MCYIEYISLGFIREDYQDNTVFKCTGHHPFSLSKKINNRMYIYVSSEDLSMPYLMIITNKEKEMVDKVLLTIKQVRAICGIYTIV